MSYLIKSDHQIFSRRFDRLQTLPHSQGAGESLTEASSKPPPKPFSSDDQSRRNLIAVARGSLVSFFALVFLMICLWAFSQEQQLSKWEQRSFNTLSILLTAIASLGLGSLLGHLGSMLRWPLLARTMYQMQDVDSILGMSPPTGSLRLIRRHVREWRISRTTVIVTAYLVTNVVGRLSVAIFGLAYNMTDKTGIEHPILATNWTSALWAGQIFHNGTADPERDEYESAEAFLNSVRNGLLKYAKVPEWTHGENGTFFFGDDISPSLKSDLQVSNATLRVGTNTVKYSYELKDFKEDSVWSTNHTVDSSVKCSLIEVDESQYWRWSNGNRTGPFSWGGEDDVGVVPEILWASNKSEVIPYSITNWVSVLDLSKDSSVSSQIYIVCDGVAWECWPTLTETVGDSPSHQIQPREKFFHPTDLYRLLAVGSGDYSYTGTKHQVYLSGFSSPSNAAAADDGAYELCNNYRFSDQYETVWEGYRLWVAGLVARLPILAIMDANTVLPRLAQGPHPDQTAGTPYLYTALEVDWLRVALTGASIISGQILATLAVLCYCNGVYTRDDSHLATAELLKTVITMFDDGKLMTGEELAASLDDVLGVPVSYGARKGQDGGPPQVDLASGLEANFPPFPQKQQL